MALGTEYKLNAYLDWLSRLRLQVSCSSHTTSENAFTDSALLEDSLISWLESKGFEGTWKLAPVLAEAGVPLSTLQELEHLVPEGSLSLAIGDVQTTLASYTAILSVTDAADRIFRLVAAVKDYSYMDRQPVQDVNISESLDTVLKLSQPKLAGITVRRFYNPDVPLLKAFGSELNQVWAALVENSLEAMAGSGTLTLSVRLQGNTILVEITDTGQGISPECANRVFEPFLLRNPLGQVWG